MNENPESTIPPGIKFYLVKRMETHKVIALTETRLQPHEQKYLEFHNVAGVILFERNIGSLSQLGDLLGAIRDKLPPESPPPLVMVDHEGDAVSVLRRLIGTPPAPGAIAAAGEPALARQVARETGREMKKLGINVVLAPVADCLLNPASPITGLRCFGSDPERVAEYVAESVAGFKEAGLISCAKHFPGHGSTPEDSHETLPVVTKSREDLARADLVPFIAAIKAGVEMVMISHVAFPLGENIERPASFDRRIISGLLRDECGFDGVVITDALDMAASRDYRQDQIGGLVGGLERPLFAGSDLLLYSQPVPSELKFENEEGETESLKVMEMIIHTLDRIIDQDRVEQKVRQAADENETLRSLLGILDRSERRILSLRDGLREDGPAEDSSGRAPAGGNVVRLEDYASTPPVYQTVADGCIVLAGDPEGFVPVAGGTDCLVMPVAYLSGLSLSPQNLNEFTAGLRRAFPSWGRTDLVVDFAEDVEGRMQPVSSRDLKNRPRQGREQEEDALESFPQEQQSFSLPAGMILLSVFSTRGCPPEDFMARFEEFLRLHQPPLMIITGYPVATGLPESLGRLCTFGASPQNAAAAARVLSGNLVPQAGLPPIFGRA
jgi:beta-glucosidase-like glycosyl hydrolase